ncbi:sugar ABC transporter substrate-binding protein [Nonomuraea sp. H19]|uniref:sugar ABC transporter substrate-binding protein n=1 Tax=Nonomuraea sp. H19 TaxID=3452206 RepID=UPI003F89655C
MPKTISPHRRLTGSAALLLLLLISAGCAGPSGTASSASSGGTATNSCSQVSAPFSTDDATDSIDYSDLAKSLGPVPAPPADANFGSIMKFLGNQYWVALAKGQTERAQKYSIRLDVQAAASESDQVGQLNAAETMLNKGYTAILASPQSDTNLCPAVEKAESGRRLVINVNDAVFPNAQRWVGPNQIQNGVSAAKYLIEKLPPKSKVAVIEGQAGVYAAKQRTKGFTDTAKQGGLDVVSSVPADWDVQKARDAAASIIQQTPDIAAFYCNNDTMALGVVEAVKAAGKQGKIMIIGTDGVEDAYKAIRAGELTATVDSYPQLTGQVSVDVAIRVLAGQKVPRAVYTPQALITKENVDTPPPTLS